MHFPAISSLVSLVLSLFFPPALPIPDAAGSSCTTPVLRREWRALTREERAHWIGAVKCLSNLPHDPNLVATVDPAISGIGSIDTSASYYDDLVYMHMDLNVKIHFTGLFLPWHRWYMRVFEKALQIKCGYTGALPYWNWVLDSQDVANSPLFLDSDPESGMGGWGDPNNDYTISDGGFARSFTLAYPVPHPLRRNFTQMPFLLGQFVDAKDRTLKANETFTPAELHKLVNGFVGDFVGFQKYLEGFNSSHSAVHLMMGGDMGGECPASAPPDCVPGPTFSPNEPLFWLHHAMIDKIWADWQEAHPAHKHVYVGGAQQPNLHNSSQYHAFPTGTPPWLNMSSRMPADGLFPEATIGSVMSTTEGMLCYVYE
ncbi:Di-copper centre-containing protein [Roridomyces roridus]|uniref:Di-copper centre-containing protein n=1 Tax=Roridomyces roridus TaxID=1738132 RepID=A0AAD7BLR3_9AGAR|nr:Di-copper centre-containing protein [Roridomyces roridus]